jgi:hypothetical protein
MKINAENVLCISAILTQLSPRGIGSTLSPSCRLYEPEAGL